MLLCPFCKNPVENSDSWHCLECGKKPEQKDSITFLSPNAVHANFSPESFPTLAQAENGHFWFEGRNRLIVSVLKRYALQSEGGEKYLEIGCGTGFVFKGIAEAFPMASVFGSEFYLAGLEVAATRTPRGKFFQMDAHDIPFHEEFDVLGAFDVLEHIENDVLVLSEMAKALKPGGHVLLTVPQHMWLWSVTDTQAEHVRRYSRKDLLRKLELAGFAIVKTTSFVSLLLPCMYLSRLTKQKEGDSEVTMRPGLLNRVFSSMMTVERKLIEAGVSFPVGGSLLVLAKKFT